MPHVVTDTVMNNEILNCFKNLNIIATEKDIDGFVAIY